MSAKDVTSAWSYWTRYLLLHWVQHEARLR